MQTLQFWFEFGSTYTYLTVARIRRVAQEAGVQVQWKPFLLMPLMIAQGMTQGPFLPYPRKLDYMWRDLERRAAEHDIPYRKPSKYPPEETLTSARLALVGAMQGWGPEFVEEAFRLHWTEDCLIGTPDNIRAALRKAGRDPEDALAMAKTPAIKEQLKAQTQEAADLGIFGSPTFMVEGEMFWGDDRLEQAIAWARGVE
jgi:2-hydroxychromene-2-carboxylate isomerase